MNDRELLELAAKAAGVEYNIVSDGFASWATTDWNPLESKYDCLQMEIDLKLDASWVLASEIWSISDGVTGKFYAQHSDRQRASTMSAAEIGRGMV